MHDADEAVRSLIEEAIKFAGSEKKLGNLCACSQNAIWNAKRAGRVSAELAVAIDRATQGQISKHQLRPDLFEPPAPPHASTVAAA